MVRREVEVDSALRPSACGRRSNTLILHPRLRCVAHYIKTKTLAMSSTGMTNKIAGSKKIAQEFQEMRDPAL